MSEIARMLLFWKNILSFFFMPWGSRTTRRETCVRFGDCVRCGTVWGEYCC